MLGGDDVSDMHAPPELTEDLIRHVDELPEPRPKPTVRLRPTTRLWEVTPQFLSCDVCMPTAVPQVQIIASKRVVEVGEPFDIKVIASANAGLKGLWWFGVGTGVPNLDKAHWHGLSGEQYHEQVWTGITLSSPGNYRFGANSRDVLYGQDLGVPHQASEGAGIDHCMVEVRDDITYDAQVDHVQATFGKSAQWSTWMKSADIRTRHEPVWQRSRTVPTTLKLAVDYGGAPLAYDPPWTSEDEHMEALDLLAMLGFPNLDFDFLFGADPTTTDVAVTIGGRSSTSTAGGSSMYLYYETIFCHEFGHILEVQHHYINNDIANPVHLPPGENECVMARNSTEYCSGCRAAMHLDLDADNASALSTAMSDISSRYPY